MRSSAASNIRRIPPAGDADRVHRGAAGMDGRAGDRLHARHAEPAGPVLRDLRRRQGAALARGGGAGTLLRSRRLVPLADLVDEDRRRVSVLDDQEEVARLFGKYNLVAAPVVDTEKPAGRRHHIDDVVDVIEEEADEDLKALGGVTSDEELSDSVWTIAKGRFNWLLVNLATAFLRPRCSACSKGNWKKCGTGRAGPDRRQSGRQLPPPKP